MLRAFERVLLFIAIAGAGAGIYLALDARDAADRAEARAVGAERALDGFTPTLVVQQRSDSPFEAPRVPPTGDLTGVQMTCPEGSVVVGGGFNGFDGATIAGSTPEGGSGGGVPEGDGWLINAYNENGGRGRVAPAALCARGEGGLRVRSTMDPEAKGEKSP